MTSPERTAVSEVSSSRWTKRFRRSLRSGTVLLGSLTLTLSALTLPAVANELYPRGVGVDPGESPVEYGASISVDDGFEPSVGEEDGQEYWSTDQSAGLTHLNLDVTDDAGIGRSGGLVITIDHLAAGSGVIVIHHEGPDGELIETVSQIYGAADGWTTSVLELSGVVLGERTHGSDLRIGIEGADLPVEDNPDLAIAAIRVLDPGPSVDLGETVQTDRASVRSGDDQGGAITGEIDGVSYWQFDLESQPHGILYFYVDVDDNYAVELTDERLIVTVEYFDEEGAQFNLQYDAHDSNGFQNSASLSTTGTDTWKQHTFVLDDAYMANRTNGADFRVAVQGDLPARISQVNVAVAPSVLDASTALTGLIDSANLALQSARVGDRDGQFPQSAVDELDSARDSAEAVMNDPDASPSDRVSAAVELAAALAAFREMQVTTSFAHTATATASSEQPGQPATDAIDRDQNTFWASGNDQDGEWFALDLGEQHTINEVVVNWGQSFSRAYTIDLSDDGEQWREVTEVGAAGAGAVVTRFPAETASHVRLSLEGYAPGSTSFAIWEVETRHAEVPETTAFIPDSKHPTRDVVVADIDATDHGADPTGATNSTAGIQRALDVCEDIGGGTVWLPAGDYLVTDTIEVAAFCSIRGDHPEGAAGTEPGTLILADVPSGSEGPSVFRIGGSAGVAGLTVFYPSQDASEPVPFGFTVEIPGRAWSGEENYMVSTVEDVTLLNSYRGIGISTYPNDRGAPARDGQVHETATVRNVQGTVLYEGAVAYNAADVGTWEDVTFSNAYWAEAPQRFNPPARETLDSWTRENGTGLVLGDLEWEQFTDVEIADYAVGIQIVSGQRVTFTGTFMNTTVVRTGTAVLVEESDPRWGLGFSASVLEGDDHAINNRSDGYVKLTETETDGSVEGTVHVLEGEVPQYSHRTDPAPINPELFVATDYGAVPGLGYIPSEDATDSIQAALDAASAGGGVVYLPAGWYRVEGELAVPAGVELRGASSVPHREQSRSSRGTVLLAYAGHDSSDSATADAFITLVGQRATISGLRVFYPENNPAEGLVPYPFTIRGDAADVTVVNVGLSNSWHGVDFTSRADNFLARKVLGAAINTGIRVGDNENGRVEGFLLNGNAPTRVGFSIPGWSTGQDVFTHVIDAYTREILTLVHVEGGQDLQIENLFAYGAHSGLVVESGEVTVVNFGTDNLSGNGYTVDNSGEVEGVNIMRYNGTTARGLPTLWTVLGINMQQHDLSVQVSDPDGSATGSVRIVGNETEPGRYERGNEVIAVATAAEGSAFHSWQVDGEVVSTAAQFDFLVTEDVHLVATFTDDPDEMVVALVSALSDHVDSGDIDGPIRNRLANTLDQAHHHLDAGRTAQAARAMERFIGFLQSPRPPDAVSEWALADLGERAAALLAVLE